MVPQKSDPEHPLKFAPPPPPQKNWPRTPNQKSVPDAPAKDDKLVPQKSAPDAPIQHYWYLATDTVNSELV